MIPPPPFLISVVRVGHSVIDNDREKSPCVFHFVHDISHLFFECFAFLLPFGFRGTHPTTKHVVCLRSEL